MDPDNAPRVMASWWPAAVSWPGPGGDRARLRRARVYITRTDIVIFDQPGDPAFVAAVDFTLTPRPPAGRTWPPPNIDIHTDAGLVIVTPGTGCGCGHPLRSWKPSWAGHLTEWSTP